MPCYRRRFVPGGTYFFTVVTEGREPLFDDELARALLRESFEACLRTRPFDSLAVVLLPDHSHALWTLPEGDDDYPLRWAAIKAQFPRAWLSAGGAERPRSVSRARHRRRGVWQRKFWEHTIRDERDRARHLDYIHWNPVKHGLARCPHEWPHATFTKWVGRGVYAPDWLCACDGRVVVPPVFEGMEGAELE